jgi:2-haloacid dehalogenase
MIEFSRFTHMSFDVYGTLIDWESGIVQALRPILESHGFQWNHDTILDAFAKYETLAQQPPYSTYRDVLAEVLHRIGDEHGFRPTTDDLLAFSSSVPDWPAFADSAESLAELKKHFKLAVITNCDDSLFEESNRNLGVVFDIIVTAEQAREYKPGLKPFHLTLEQVGEDPGNLIHVAQSMYHDHAPAKSLGLTTVWINRRHDKPGLGATPPATATPDLELPDLRSLVSLCR